MRRNICSYVFTIILGFVLQTSSFAQQGKRIEADQFQNIIPGAERLPVYLPFLKGKRVGVFANQTSLVGQSHLVDTLLSLGVNIQTIFSPEHGFRGTSDAGEKVDNSRDAITGIKIISAYSKKTAVRYNDLNTLDVLVFDLQDVGCRFYTYINSMQYFLEAALINHKPLLLLDRPNPNGFYVDGPVLDLKFKSGVGLQRIPIVYGMTMAEYAMMLLGEKWLSDKANSINSYNITTEPTADTPFHFLVIKCQNYTHKSKYVPPIYPSPNLPEIQSIYLYPTTCLFEGTSLSEGRGTDKPFAYIGDPSLPKNMFSFIPTPREGAKSSKHYGKICYGWDFSGTPEEVLNKANKKIQLGWIIEAYKIFPDKKKFFLKTNSFDKLAGNSILRKQIIEGKTEDEIRKSWESDLNEFKKIRKKYLLYEDFE